MTEIDCTACGRGLAPEEATGIASQIPTGPRVVSEQARYGRSGELVLTDHEIRRLRRLVTHDNVQQGFGTSDLERYLEDLERMVREAPR